MAERPIAAPGAADLSPAPAAGQISRAVVDGGALAAGTRSRADAATLGVVVGGAGADGTTERPVATPGAADPAPAPAAGQIACAGAATLGVVD
eukprot:2603641-Lingulodinium_polyedra.AAC.1